MGWIHFQLHPWFSFRVSYTYNKNYYLEHNVDLASGIGNNSQELLEHFVKHGMAEGRQAKETFNVQAYKTNNPDLANAFKNDLRAYYMHYINNGKSEGRIAIFRSVSETEYGGIDYSAVYNCICQVKSNPFFTRKRIHF